MIDQPFISPLGRTAKDVCSKMIGMSFGADSQIIGEITHAWIDGFDIWFRVKFRRKEANLLKQEQMPMSEQELPEIREYKLKRDSWDKIFSWKLRCGK